MRPARALARALGIIHNISYYSRETKAFAQVGLPEFWRAYVAYRVAPLGAVGPAAATAALYNFAPRMVGDALPSAWETVTPSGAINLRNECMQQALERAFAGFDDTAAITQAAALAETGIRGTDTAGKVLFAGHVDLPWPETQTMRLWHACTLWREHRGDCHNIALAAAQIDGVEAHVLLAARGVGSAAVIHKIRGWNSDEWLAATQRLAERGLVAADGSSTPAGRTLRSEIEAHTDELSREPRDRLGDTRCAELTELAERIADHFVSTGAVAGKWPPDKPIGRTQT